MSTYVAITAAESVGVEHRGGYYDHAGALRDMVQNHLMQLLCLVAMEPMVSFDADEIRNKKVDVLHAVRPIPKEAVHQNAVRGQYGPGWIEGKKVPGYRQEEDVAPDSATETFVALKPLPRQLALAGRALSTCAPASGSPGTPRKSRSSFAKCRITPFRRRPLSTGIRRGW